MSYGRGDLTPGGGGSYGNSGDQYSSSYQNEGRSSQADYTRLTQLISSNIQKVQQNVQDIRRMVEQLGSSSDTSELRDRLHQRQHYTNQLSKDTAKYIKDVKALAPAYPASEQRHRRTQTDRLMSEFSDVLNRFQAVQRDAASKEKESIARARAASASQDHSGDVLVSIQGEQLQEQAQISQEEIKEIEERQAAIQQLEADIVDVNMIFKDLGAMVHEQGDMIDSIEANVESAADNVQAGNKQLVQARSSAASARKKKIICGIIVIVLIIVLILIIYFSTKPN
uniref:syntaxin-7-like isoform X1 n=1 Tax=Styela clava TaxID=7725 RepID=UPI001939C57F|nr:syntaxin-7-like isoform X1 [Styela clava]